MPQLKLLVSYVALFASFSISLNTFADNQTTPVFDTISVVGQGKIEVVPDEVLFSVGIDAQAPRVLPAYGTAEHQTAAAIKILKRIGIREKNIQAMAINIHPVIDHKSREREIIAHKVTRDINVKANSVENYAKAIQQLAEIGVTRFHQVQMKASNEEALQIEALEKAYANAEEKAKRLASKGWREIDKLLTLVESGASQPQPIYKMRTVAMEADLASSATISAGVITISRSVQATFKLTDSE